MTPAIYLLKSQLRRIHPPASPFLVIGGALVAGALFTQTHMSILALWLTSGTCAIALALIVRLLARALSVKNGRWSFRACADDTLVWQDQFADTDNDAPLVLIAAADVFMRGALDFHLVRAGFRVEHAASCDEALAKAKRHPAAVLLDLSMPNGNGFYCLRDIRYASAESKIIAFARKRHPHDATICRRLGAYESLPKPFDPKDAATRVIRALNDDPVARAAYRLSA